MYTADQTSRMTGKLVDNIFVKFGGCLFHQVIGIPLEMNCAPLLAYLFLYLYESKLLDRLVRSGHRRLARPFNLCYRTINDFNVFNNKKFADYVKDIYPFELNVEKANRSDGQANYLDLTFMIGNNNRLYTKLYDKRDDFNLIHIVSFPFLSSNIPSGSFIDVAHIMMILGIAINSQWKDFFLGAIKVNQLRNSFQKFYGRYPDLVAKYQKSVRDMLDN